MVVETMLDRLVIANLVGAAAIILVFILRSPVRWLAGSRATYALWLIPPLAAIGSLLPAGSVAVQMPEGAMPMPAGPGALPSIPMGPVQAVSSGAAIDWMLVVSAIWLIGVAISILVLIARHRAAMQSLGELTADETDMLRTAHAEVGPAVVGVLAPRIVLPTDFEIRYDEVERGAILAHERAHIDGRHVMAKLLAQGLVCINWFNPLVHMAAAAVSVDQEMACDEVVVSKDPSVKKAYAKALLKTQTGCVLPLGCYWPAYSSKLLRQRICLVSVGAKGSIPRAGAFGLIALLAAGGMVSAWAAQPPRVVEYQDTRVEIVALTAPGGPEAPTAPVRNAALVASSIKAGRTRDVLVAGGTATEAADALRQGYHQKGWSTDGLPVRGSERFASFQDGEFGIAGRIADGKVAIVNDGRFDEYPHPAGLAQARTLEIVRSGRPQGWFPVAEAARPGRARMTAAMIRQRGVPEQAAEAIPLSEPERLAAFAANDRNRDGRLNPGEYMGVLRTLGYPDQFRINWPQRDKNGDNFVSAEEYRLPLPSTSSIAPLAGAAPNGVARAIGATVAVRRPDAVPRPASAQQNATVRPRLETSTPAPPAP